MMTEIINTVADFVSDNLGLTLLMVALFVLAVAWIITAQTLSDDYDIDPRSDKPVAGRCRERGKPR